MARVLVSNRVDRDFSIIPNALWSADLPFQAKAVACYLLSLRDGAMPYVAEMEAALGIGRDARRKAFAALEAIGFLSWHVERSRSGAIVAKTLVLDHGCFSRAPESQADGQNHHAPENPAGGKSAPVGVESRPCSDGVSGDTLKQDKIKKGPIADKRRARAPAVAVSPADSLSSFQRSSIAQDRSVMIGGRLVKSGSDEMRQLQAQLRNGLSSLPVLSSDLLRKSADAIGKCS